MAAPANLSLDTLSPERLSEIVNNLGPGDIFRLYGINKSLNATLQSIVETTPSLTISHPSFREPFLKFISQFPNLKNVDLSHSYYLTDDLVEQLVEKCPKIEVLKLWNCLSLRDGSLKAISKLANLRDLNIGDNTHITSAGVIEVVTNCKKLERLDISGCNRIDGTLAEPLAKNCENLEFLNAEFCLDFITDQTLQVFSKGNLKKLKQLLLMGGSITDEGIRVLATSPLNVTLRVLDLRRNNEIQTEGYNYLSDYMKLDEIDGCVKDQLPENIGEYFLLIRKMQDDQ